jgi:rare lipoprotein A (peptidoglycan hydrolase)
MFLITQKHLFRFAAIATMFVVFMTGSANASSHHSRDIKNKGAVLHKQSTNMKTVIIRKNKQIGIASYYGYESGSRTAMGTRFYPLGLSAAHRTLPLASKVRVTNLKNNRSVTVTINDRGPYKKGRMIDLSLGAARALGITGIQKVSIETI